MDEWTMLTKITDYMNKEDYKGLETFLIDHQEKVGTRWAIDALTELPIDEDLIVKHRILYETVVKHGESVKIELGLRGAIRIETFKLRLESLN